MQWDFHNLIINLTKTYNIVFNGEWLSAFSLRYRNKAKDVLSCNFYSAFTVGTNSCNKTSINKTNKAVRMKKNLTVSYPGNKIYQENPTEYTKVFRPS